MDPGRVAEILVEIPGTSGRRGSGYRVSGTAVLTSAHVVAGASRIRVRCNADRDDEWIAEAAETLVCAAGDGAVLVVRPPETEGHIEPTGFGRISDHDAVLACTAMGFPRFKLRDDHARRLPDGDPSQYRDTLHLVGTAPILSNRREGTLEICVESPPAADPDPERSPWEGMSGAAVFAHGRIIGLISEHHRSDGLARLAATRCDSWYGSVEPERLGRLRDLLGMPEEVSGLTDIVPPDEGALIDAVYTAQVRSIAPARLEERDDELAALTAFCAGQESYQWWQAPPWAGKTALMSWFALHPPVGVRVASFFVTSRMSGEADSDAFIHAMVDQLSTLAGESPTLAVSKAARGGQFLHLLEVAARRLRGRDRRLVLVVDGLDEDQGRQPSIVAMLPRHVPDGVRVLVSSRTNPGVPGDVPGDHPIRHCPRRQLTPSSYARHIAVEAKNELYEQLRGGRPHEEIIGLIIASGGGLTIRELAELTGRAKYDVEGQLGSLFGRSLRSRFRTEDEERAFLFAHETLRMIAEETLGDDVVPYRDRIHAWADTYRTAGWPDTTPNYLLRAYGLLLIRHDDRDRLAAIARDQARHELMMRRTGSDFDALREITATQDRLVTDDDPDLTTLALLAFERTRLGERGSTIAPDLPGVLAQLGRVEHAEALARSNTRYRAEALGRLAAALAESDRSRAQSLIGEALGTADAITDPAERITAWCAIVGPLTTLNRHRTHALVARVTVQISNFGPDGSARMLRDLTQSLATAGLYDEAERIAATIGPLDQRARTFAAIAKATATADPARAARVAETATQAADILEAWERADVLAELAEAFADVDPVQAAEAIDVVRQAAQDAKPRRQAWTEHSLVRALAAGGRYDEAERVARTISDASRQAMAFDVLITALARAQLYDQAERIAVSVNDPWHRDSVMATLTQCFAESGLFDRAKRAADMIDDVSYRAIAFTEVAKPLAGLNPERAALAAEDAVRASTQVPFAPWYRIDLLAAVATALAEVDPERAASVAQEAAQTARSEPDPDIRHYAAEKAVRALAAVGAFAQAVQVASAMSESLNRDWSLRSVHAEAIRLGRVDNAAQVAGQLFSDQPDRGEVWVTAYAALRSNRPPRKEDVKAVLRVVSDTLNLRSHAQRVGLMQAAAAAGLLDQPTWIIESMPFAEADAWSAIAGALATIDPVRASDAAERAVRASREHSSDWILIMVEELSAAAEALAKIDLERAVQVVSEAWDAVPDGPPHQRDRAFNAVAPALAAAGLLDEAEQAARSITDSLDQTWALADVAERIARAGPAHTRRAARLVANLLTGEDWMAVLPALAVLDPGAVRAVHDALSAATARTSG